MEEEWKANSKQNGPEDGGVQYAVRDSRDGPQFPEHTNCLPMKKHLPEQKPQRVGAWGQAKKQDWRN